MTGPLEVRGSDLIYGELGATGFVVMPKDEALAASDDDTTRHLALSVADDRCESTADDPHWPARCVFTRLPAGVTLPMGWFRRTDSGATYLAIPVHAEPELVAVFRERGIPIERDDRLVQQASRTAGAGGAGWRRIGDRQPR